MNSHTRIQCNANITAIQQLDCSSYKILMYLACRSNQYGTCFPYGVTIARDTKICEKTVYSALAELVTYGYIKYLRNAYHNRFTNESTPPLFQVSPHFLEIADEFLSDAMALWTGKNGNGKFYLSNQQQEPALANNAITQIQETTTTTNNRDSEKETTTAKSETPKTTAQQTNNPKDEKRESSAIVKNYTNPILIPSEIEALQEALAQKLTDIGIKIIMARGFIVQYGYAQCELAHNHLQFLLTRQQIDNPAGFYRYLLQSNMANVLPSLRERDSARHTEYDSFLES